MGITTRFRFSPSRLAGLRPRERAYFVTDADSPGLTLRVGPSGVKSWWWRFYWHGKRQVLVLPGAYPGTGIADAHELARLARDYARKGIDPRRAGILERHARRPTAPRGAAGTADAAHSVEALVADYQERHVRKNLKRPEYIEWMLAKYVLPAWRNRDARTIKPREVSELLFAIADRGRKSMANHVAHVVTQLFLHGVERHFIETTPVQMLRKKPGGRERPRERALSDEELKAFLADPVAATRYARLGHVILVLLLTAARRGELTQARWADVDLAKALWHVPAENAKSGRPHLVPLSPLAAAEFRALKKLAGRSRWVLPGKDPSRPVEPKLLTRGVAKCLKRFEAIGVGPFRLHDLRRTARTGLARLKVQPHVAELCLSHRIPGIAGVYDVHDYMGEKREALARWAAHLEGLKPTSGG